MRALLLLPLLAAAANAQATASLVADRESVAPGGTFRVGVRFRLEPGWHIYWRNPGDSGQPPSIRWKGIDPSPIEWPVPERIPTPPFMTFGYEGEVTLTASVSVPEGYAGATLPVAADVDWLACDSNGCIPGEAELSMEIPVRPGDAPPEAIAKGMPEAAGEVSARYRGGRIVLLAAAPGAPSYFFPGEGGMVEPAEIQHPVVQGERKGLLLTPAKTAQGPVKILRGVLAFDGGPAWEVEVPVEAEAASGGGFAWLVAAAAVAFAFVAHRMLRSRKESMS